MPPQYPLFVGLRLRLTQPTKLLITDGLRDAYVRVGGSVWGTQLLAVYEALATSGVKVLTRHIDIQCNIKERLRLRPLFAFYPTVRCASPLQ